MLLLLLLLLEHVRLLRLQMRECMSIGGTCLHAHHRASLRGRAAWSGYALVHHSLRHRVSRSRSAHHMSLLHWHAGLRWERALHHLGDANRRTRPHSLSERIRDTSEVHRSAVRTCVRARLTEVRGTRYAVKRAADETLQGPVRRRVDLFRVVYQTQSLEIP